MPKAKPVQSTITQRAMLAGLGIATWSARKFDKKETEAVLAKHQAKKGAARVNKALLDAGHPKLRAISTAAGQIRDYHYTNTLPWADSGYRLLPSKHYFEYTQGLRELRETFDSKVEEFLAEYPQMKEEAKDILNTMYDEADYPATEALRAKFYCIVKYMPMPDANDFRVTLGEEEEKAVRASIEKEVSTAIGDAIYDLVLTFADKIEKLHERLADPANKFQDSLLENLREVCDLIPKLNLTHDTRLEDLRQRTIQSLLVADPKTLRKDEAQRAEIAQQAENIFADLEAFMTDLEQEVI